MTILKILKVLLFSGSRFVPNIYFCGKNYGVVNKQEEQVSPETESTDDSYPLIDQMRG